MPLDFDSLASIFYHYKVNIVIEEIMIFIYRRLNSYHFLLIVIHYLLAIICSCFIQYLYIDILLGLN